MLMAVQAVLETMLTVTFFVGMGASSPCEPAILNVEVETKTSIEVKLLPVAVLLHAILEPPTSVAWSADAEVSMRAMSQDSGRVFDLMSDREWVAVVCMREEMSVAQLGAGDEQVASRGNDAVPHYRQAHTERDLLAGPPFPCAIVASPRMMPCSTKSN